VPHGQKRLYIGGDSAIVIYSSPRRLFQEISHGGPVAREHTVY
jgi:hypothetical protein